MQEVVCANFYIHRHFMDPFPITEINKIVLIALLSTSAAVVCCRAKLMQLTKLIALKLSRA